MSEINIVDLDTNQEYSVDDTKIIKDLDQLELTAIIADRIMFENKETLLNLLQGLTLLTTTKIPADSASIAELFKATPRFWKKTVSEALAIYKCMVAWMLLISKVVNSIRQSKVSFVNNNNFSVKAAPALTSVKFGSLKSSLTTLFSVRTAFNLQVDAGSMQTFYCTVTIYFMEPKIVYNKDRKSYEPDLLNSEMEVILYETVERFPVKDFTLNRFKRLVEKSITDELY